MLFAVGRVEGRGPPGALPVPEFAHALVLDSSLLLTSHPLLGERTPVIALVIRISWSARPISSSLTVSPAKPFSAEHIPILLALGVRIWIPLGEYYFVSLRKYPCD